MPSDWDQRFLHLARVLAAFSKDPSTKVGAIATRDRHILATGYNGLPRNVDDKEHRLRDRSTRLAMTVHAEANLIAHASRHGVCLAASTVYIWPLMCCSQCAALLIQSNVSRIVIPDYIEPLRWMESFSFSRQMLAEAGIIVDTVSMDFVARQHHSSEFATAGHAVDEDVELLTIDERIDELQVRHSKGDAIRDAPPISKFTTDSDLG